MDRETRQRFSSLWKKHFNGADWPLVSYYTDRPDQAEHVSPPSGHQCVIGVLARVRRGASLCFDGDSIGCHGGKRYLGYAREIMPEFEYFLSCGIPGRLEGERYKKTPVMVTELMKRMPEYKAPGRFIVFKRWDRLEASDTPEVVNFLAPPDVLSGLFTLVNFDEVEPDGVFGPFCAGCAALVQYPYLEARAERPRAVLGMFDVSARPFVPRDTLSFSVPVSKFERMVGNMDESFLITPSWGRVKKRIGKGAEEA